MEPPPPGAALFALTGTVLPVPADVAALFDGFWRRLASPGPGWSGVERVAIAATARGGDGRLSATAVEAARTIASSPGSLTRQTVRRFVDDLGESRYVELAGVVACLSAVDSLTGMLGAGAAPLPEPLPGPATGGTRPRRLRSDVGWVAMAFPPVPRNAFSAVPEVAATMSRILDRLYMPSRQRWEPVVRHLTWEQMEIIVVAVSLANRCFYCTLGHLLSLQSSARRSGMAVDIRGIVDPEVDSGVPAARELVRLAGQAGRAHPDPAAVEAVATAIGPEAAITAVEQAAAFQMTNRAVQATGLPVLRGQRERAWPELEILGATGFDRTDRTVEPERRLAARLRRRIGPPTPP